MMIPRSRHTFQLGDERATLRIALDLYVEPGLFGESVYWGILGVKDRTASGSGMVKLSPETVQALMADERKAHELRGEEKMLSAKLESMKMVVKLAERAGE